MGINVGWYSGNGYTSGSAPAGVFDPLNFSQYSGTFTGGNDPTYFCAGVQGYTTGIVEWLTVWEPTYRDIEPESTSLWGFGGPLEIRFPGGSDPKRQGVLTIYAVINGVILPNKLRLTIAAGMGDYGDYSWEAFAATIEPMEPYGDGGPPSLGVPSQLPRCRWIGHAIEMRSVYANVPAQTGHDRRRRVYTKIPRAVSVSWDFNLEQSLAFYEWYEESLASGLNEFAIQVANQGPGLLWWRARFIEPYVAEANESGQAFWVSAKVLLSGEGVPDTPYTPEMFSAVTVALLGSVKLTTAITISSSVVVAMLPVRLLYAKVNVALKPLFDGAVMREGGGNVLREDGSYAMRES